MYSGDVWDLRIAVALVGSMVALGCGRYGFSHPGPGSGSADDDDDVPCSVMSYTVSEGSTRALTPIMMWNGTKFGVSWFEDAVSQSDPSQAHFRTLSSDGTMDPIANLGAGEEFEGVQVGWDGASWRLAWTNTATNSAIMVSTDGGAARALTANARSNYAPHVASMSGGATAYLWQNDATTNNIRLSIIDAAGNKLVDDRAVVTADNVPGTQLVWTGSELVAFYAVSTKIMMLRMTSGGSPIAPAAAVATVPAGTPAVSEMFAAWAHDRIMLAWMASGDFAVTYVSRDGVQQFAPVVVARYGGFNFITPSLAVGADWDAIVYDAGLNHTSYLVEVYRDGSLGKPEIFDNASRPVAAWLGKTWSVAVAQTQPNAKPDYIKLVQLCR
jgi:hypothetical protein